MLYFTRGGGPVAVAAYQFGDFRLACGLFELLRNDRAIRLERKPMELLILLLASDGQLVTRTEIAGHLWSSEVFVDTEHGRSEEHTSELQSPMHLVSRLL